MSKDKSERTRSDRTVQKRKDRAAEIANTFEWLITAFVLAFVIRAFIMEAFRIPTGSMAHTLKGAHFRLCCPQCGYEYDYGYSSRNDDSIPPGNVDLPPTCCPNCNYEMSYNQFTRVQMPVANGDRILVLKCIYQFFEPRRWDIIVFKNPLDPTENYIKRLIGLPGEELEIIDGDIYINGRIKRKPPKVQNDLWMLIYNNDYQPVRPREGSFNGYSWQQPFKNEQGSKWIVNDKETPTLFRLDSPADRINTLLYRTSNGTDFKATYAYNNINMRRANNLPFCSDLMVRFYADSGSKQGRVGTELSKYGTHYKAWVNLTGEMVITKNKQGEQTIELKRKRIRQPVTDESTLVKFAIVDHELTFEFGKEKLTCDLGSGPRDAGPIEPTIEPQVKIFGAGKLTLSHIAICRDIHYTRYRVGDNKIPGRATQDNSFPLREDEFFVLGDNSPNSEDSRWWSKSGVANNGLYYREGIVPRDYLVGKALFVYWPSGFEFPWPKSLKNSLLRNRQGNLPFRIIHTIVSLGWIPNVGQMRFVYGGSSKNQNVYAEGE